jgi:hypothetical protein
MFSKEYEFVPLALVGANRESRAANLEETFPEMIPEAFPQVTPQDYVLVIQDPEYEDTAAAQRAMTVLRKEHDSARTIAGAAVDRLLGQFPGVDEGVPAIIMVFRHSGTQAVNKVDMLHKVEAPLPVLYKALHMYADMWMHGFYIDAAMLVNKEEPRVGIVRRVVDVVEQITDEQKFQIESLASNTRQLRWTDKSNRSRVPPPAEIRAFAQDLYSLYQSHLSDKAKDGVFESVVQRVEALVPMESVVKASVAQNEKREVINTILNDLNQLNTKSKFKTKSNNNNNSNNINPAVLRRVLARDREDVLEALLNRGGLTSRQAERLLDDLERHFGDRRPPRRSWMDMMFGRSPSRWGRRQGKSTRMRKITFEKMNEWRLRRH